MTTNILHAIDQADLALGTSGLAENNIFRRELRDARASVEGLLATKHDKTYTREEIEREISWVEKLSHRPINGYGGLKKIAEMLRHFTQSPRIEDRAAGDVEWPTHLDHDIEYLKSQSDNGKFKSIPSGLDAGYCYKLAEELESLRTALASATPSDTWRCYHCGEVLTTNEGAAEHFGTHERHNAACTIDITEYRAMEQRMERYNEEDSDLHRTMYGMQNQHQVALRRAEEEGYAKGLRDATPSAAVGEGAPVAWMEPELLERFRLQRECGPSYGECAGMHSKTYSVPLYTTPTKPGQDTVLLGELLAVLHRDGGHYQAEHGTAKAVKDAIDAFYAKPGNMVELSELERIADEWEESEGIDPSNSYGNAILECADGLRRFVTVRRSMLNATQGGKGEGDV